MNSLADLNWYSLQPLTFEDDRPPQVIFDNLVGSPQEISIPPGQVTHYVPVGLNILEIVKPNLANTYYFVDVSSIPGATVSWPSLPAGVNTSEVSPGLYSVGVLSTVEQWEAVKSPVISIASPAESQDYVAYVQYYPNNVNGWSVRLVVTVQSDMFAYTNLSATAANMTKRGYATLDSIFNRSFKGGLLWKGNFALNSNTSIGTLAQIYCYATGDFNSVSNMASLGHANYKANALIESNVGCQLDTSYSYVYQTITETGSDISPDLCLVSQSGKYVVTASRYLISGAIDTVRIRVYTTSNNTLYASYSYTSSSERTNYPVQMAIDYDATVIVVGRRTTLDPSVMKISTLTRSNSTLTPSANSTTSDRLRGLRMSSDGQRILVLGSTDSVVYGSDLTYIQAISHTTAPYESFADIEYSSDMSTYYVAVPATTTTVKIYRGTSGFVLNTTLTINTGIRAIKFSRNAACLGIGVDNGSTSYGAKTYYRQASTHTWNSGETITLDSTSDPGRVYAIPYNYGDSILVASDYSGTPEATVNLISIYQKIDGVMTLTNSFGTNYVDFQYPTSPSVSHNGQSVAFIGSFGTDSGVVIYKDS